MKLFSSKKQNFWSLEYCPQVGLMEVCFVVVVVAVAVAAAVAVSAAAVSVDVRI